MKNIVLTSSLLLNVVLILAIAYCFTRVLEGCAEVADGRIGVLNHDIQVGYFNKDKKLFTLPKGLVVREASATGAGWFEPYRFRLVITSNRENLVRYEDLDLSKLPNDSEYYSADVASNQ